MKRKFCLTPNPSQAGLDIPSVPKVTERLRDIRLDRDQRVHHHHHHNDDHDTTTTTTTSRRHEHSPPPLPVELEAMDTSNTTTHTVDGLDSYYNTSDARVRTPSPSYRDLPPSRPDSSATTESGSTGSELSRDGGTSPRPPETPPSAASGDDVFCLDETDFAHAAHHSHGRRKTKDKTCSGARRSLGKEDLDHLTKMGSPNYAMQDLPDKKLPTVFKWDGGGKQVYLSGSFDNWKSKIPLVRSHGEFYTIVDVPEGSHQFKYYVDGQWMCDPNQTQVDNDVGSKNNQVVVSSSDFEVFEALAMDSVGESPDQKTGGPGSPQGEYSQTIPPRNSGPGYHHGGPPMLPQHLLQVILNKDVPAHNEPNLLPEPNHVMLNHLYALSIKDGVMVLSATHRYRKKYVTTLLYKPIDG